MDWFSWLSKTGLEPSLVYEYGLAFAHNELEEDDIAYFNHEFLQSMGISIAKHRLEILKLARKEKGTTTQHAISRVVIAIKRTKRSLSKCIKAWIHHEKNALVLVPNRPAAGYAARWRGAMLKRNNKLMMGKQGKTLLLTNGRRSPRLDGFSSPSVYDLNKEERYIDGDDDHDDDDDGYWSTGVEEIRWDTMFQNLKPT